jgi:hypothetical protein
LQKIQEPEKLAILLLLLLLKMFKNKKGFYSKDDILGLLRASNNSEAENKAPSPKALESVINLFIKETCYQDTMNVVRTEFLKRA